LKKQSQAELLLTIALYFDRINKEDKKTYLEI